MSYPTAPPIAVHVPTAVNAITSKNEHRKRVLRQAMVLATYVWDAAIVAVPVISLILIANRAAIAERAADSAGLTLPAGIATPLLMVGLTWCGFWWGFLTFAYAVVMVTLVVLYHCR